MESYDVVVCSNCGFVYADNIPSQDDFNNYYTVMSKYEFDYKNGVVSNSYIEHFTKIVNFLIPHITDFNAKILDIGCSTGALLSIFKLNGYSNLLGIDPSPSCVRATKELYNIEASVNNIFNFNTNEKFDLIILSAVLEHLVDFNNSMQKIRSLLKDRGLLFIEVPDAERFVLYISMPFQQFSIEHINYFSQNSIRNLLSKFSFEIIELQKNENRINQSIDPDIFILSRKSNENNFIIKRDDICELKIRNYISQCAELDLKIKKVIQEKLSNKNKIIVWGVGTHTQRMLGSILDLSKILFFVDSNIRYIGKKLKGIEIKSPSDIKEEGIPILISTYSYQEEIAYQIKEILKLNNEIITIY
ncbi:MAG: class I SAM-dependent methyltransferase [Candidatus Omnitrophica bacterium]|nr:class I SAM-dependent methyltransferase [Candidatus Omnitrophota bacterium]